jgi:hypothetical protein
MTRHPQPRIVRRRPSPRRRPSAALWPNVALLCFGVAAFLFVIGMAQS